MRTGKSPSLVVFAMLLTAMLCVSCASTRYDANARSKTARAIGGVTSEQVRISNLHAWMKKPQFPLAVTPVGGTWEAETPKGHYTCEADDMLRRSAVCVKR